jgi:hypothetical protein
MVIKSLSRKNYKKAVRDLVNYIERRGVGQPITHNCASIQAGDDLIQELEFNITQLPDRKGGNVVYHEILAFSSHQPNIPKETMIDLAQEYLRLRAPMQQAFARCHLDTECPHVHLAITAGNLLGERVSLSRAEFQKVKVELEQIQERRYPELSASLVQGRKHSRKNAKSKGRQAGERRNKSLTGKEWKPTLQEQAQQALKTACATPTRKAFISSLQKAGYRLYERGGKITGIENITTGKRHRLKTLKIDELFRLALQRWQIQEKEKRLRSHGLEPSRGKKR